MTAVLETRGLTKRYGAKVAVQNLSLSIDQGHIFGLLGPNGSGKTTTLSMILDIIKPPSGEFRWFGRPGKSIYGMQIGALLEKPNFFPYLSARQNLQMTATIRGIGVSEIDLALTRVGLESVANRAVRAFSLGMQQRLAIAAASLGQPQVLILDEPTNGLDPEGIAEIREFILNEARTGRTVILASHNLSEVEKVCTHMAIMREGEILIDGDVQDILTVEDRVEVSAADLSQLASQLQAKPIVQTFERCEDGFLVTLRKDASIAELNRSLVESGVYPSRLMQRKKSLESQFLEILERSCDF